jgi:hypothetical protein
LYPSYKLNSESAESAEISMQRVTLLREYDTGERAGENNMPGLKDVPEWTNLVGEPGHAERRVTQHSGGQTGLLDLRIAVHDAPHPAQIDIHRSNWPPAHRDAGRGAVIRNCIDDLALILQARIDDFDRSVARKTSVRPTPGPANRLPMMKASSTSTRGLQ